MEDSDIMLEKAEETKTDLKGKSKKDRAKEDRRTARAVKLAVKMDELKREMKESTEIADRLDDNDRIAVWPKADDSFCGAGTTVRTKEMDVVSLEAGDHIRVSAGLKLKGDKSAVVINLDKDILESFIYFAAEKNELSIMMQGKETPDMAIQVFKTIVDCLETQKKHQEENLKYLEETISAMKAEGGDRFLGLMTADGLVTDFRDGLPVIYGDDDEDDRENKKEEKESE